MKDTKIFDGIPSIGYEMFLDSQNVEDKETTLIADFEICSEILKELLKYEETSVASIELIPEFYNGYKHEYLLTIDADKCIWIQPLRNKLGIVRAYEDEYTKIIYVHGDVSTSILNDLTDKRVQPFIFCGDI